MPGARIELARCRQRGILSPVRLPVPPSRRVGKRLINRETGQRRPTSHDPILSNSRHKFVTARTPGSFLAGPRRTMRRPRQ